jgi:hypothetical protein
LRANLPSTQDQGGKVSLKQLVVQIDREIARLQEARDLLAEASAPVTQRGRKAQKPGQRTLSAASRKRIGEAMKRRWAERKKAG